MSETTDRRDARYRSYVAAWIDAATTSAAIRMEFGGDGRTSTDELVARMLGARDRLFKFHEPLKDQATVDQEVDALLGVGDNVTAAEIEAALGDAKS